MLPLLVGALALAALSRGSRDPGRTGPAPGQAVIELDPALPPQEVAQVIEMIQTVTPATVVQIDAMSDAYRQRGLRRTAYELALRAWDVRGRRGAPPSPPHAGANGPPPPAQMAPPVGCLDASADPAMCAAVTSAILTETNADKLNAFAAAIRAYYPMAAEALASKAMVLSGQVQQAAGGAPYASAGDGAPGTNGTQSWVEVASDQSNVPPQYHEPLAAMLQHLAHDETMVPGTERAVMVGDRLFVFVKPQPGPDVPAGAVWIVRMADGSAQQSATTGYGSGPLWPVDIINGAMVPPDRRYMGSPTIYDPATSILSPPPAIQTVLQPVAPVQAVETVFVGQQQHATGAEMGSSNDGEPVPMYVPDPSLAASVASMPQGAAFARGGGDVPGIMGASRPEIVGPTAEQAAMEAAALEAAQFEQHAQMQEAMLQEHAQMQAAEQHAQMQRTEMEAAAEAHVEQALNGAQSSSRPRPSTYVVIRTRDNVWPATVAKIGSGNKNKRNYEQLAAMNPHLVSPEGAWRQLYAGDEVCIPPVWAQNLQRRGFQVQSDEGS